MARLYVEDQGFIYNSVDQPHERRIAFFTSLCHLSDGTILSSFQLGPGKHSPTSSLGICRSSDGGSTWEEIPFALSSVVDGVPGSLGAGELTETAAGRVLLFATWFDRSEPTRPLFDPETQGILRSKQLISESTDHGVSWGPWRELCTAPLKGTALTGPVLKWSDGRIGFAFESFKEFDDPSPGYHTAWLVVSEDGGATFRRPHQVARHPDDAVYYWDQRLIAESKPGEYFGLFWTHDLKGQKDLSVHCVAGSVDGTSTLQAPQAPQAPQTPPAPQATGIPGQIAAPLRLADGTLLAFVVDRNQPATMTLWQSEDDGRSWPADQRLVVYTHDERAVLTQGQENIDFSQYWEDMGKWSFGHPALIPLDQKHVLAGWYAGTPTHMSIRWARIRIQRG